MFNKAGLFEASLSDSRSILCLQQVLFRFTINVTMQGVEYLTRESNLSKCTKQRHSWLKPARSETSLQYD